MLMIPLSESLSRAFGADRGLQLHLRGLRWQLRRRVLGEPSLRRVLAANVYGNRPYSV